MRNTKQRDLVLGIINNSREHLTAEEIYEIARGSMPNISLGTVYRNLNQLVDANQIMRIKTNEGMDRYDHALIKHHHFICNNCSHIEDIYQDFELPADIVPNSKILDYNIIFKGICSDCLKKEE